LQSKVLAAYIQMASKQRADVEAAVSSLLELASTDPNNVPVLLALAHGFMLLKQARSADAVGLGEIQGRGCFCFVGGGGGCFALGH